MGTPLTMERCEFGSPSTKFSYLFCCENVQKTPKTLTMFKYAPEL